ncbi:magnesium/cobalt transporter CorA [Echinicola sp. CAU 1574]|uniref:Magnesium transport protein CorA n=1 Tax=Echinicola arenosa TaxID=2774144 RepID=A0ABR9AIY7_9BACT|nr:magnesium/cobalt transporter CorA [Echinicola arenosa]MBD8487579.1 magnesium/cobalt transporter CorA [Echinicola arenosa]
MSKNIDIGKITSPILELYSFGENKFEKHLIKNVEQVQPFLLQQDSKFWLNISTISNKELITQIGSLFNLHPLVIEAIISSDQRPKIEEFDDYIFIVTKMLYSKNGIKEIQVEHLSILFGSNFIISFQENPQDIFDPIRTRLENPKGKMRRLGTDYFTYTLIDSIVDEYYTILELIADAIEKMEDRIIGQKNNINLSDIYHHRKTLSMVRKNSWPMREIFSQWKKSDHALIKKKNITYINDIYENSIEILENLELQREAMGTLAEMYMTQLSTKQNEVMKTLTVIATIFIPLTFIAGVYGMNFKEMPELEWSFGYPLIWLIFIILTALMIYYFKRKKWF